GRFFLNPEISMLQKKELLQKVITDVPLRDFLLLLLRKGRFKSLPAIAEKYHRLVQKSEGTQEATLITAQTAPEDLKARLQRHLERIYNQRLSIRETIDPEIIGGALLICDYKLSDFSIKGRLEKMRKHLLHKVYHEPQT